MTMATRGDQDLKATSLQGKPDDLRQTLQAAVREQKSLVEAFLETGRKKNKACEKGCNATMNGEDVRNLLFLTEKHRGDLDAAEEARQQAVEEKEQLLMETDHLKGELERIWGGLGHRW